MESEDLRAQAVAAGVSAETLAKIDKLGGHSMRAAPDQASHECRFADVPHDVHLEKVSITPAPG